MILFALRRLGSGLVLLVVICAIAYTLLFFNGSSIARNIVGDQATPEQVALKEQELGLDQPLAVRFLTWAGDALAGDLGRSWFGTLTVADALTTRLPVTLALVTVSMVLVTVLATVLGTAAAVKRGWVDRAVQIGAVVGDAVPGFVLAIVLATLFAVRLPVFPAVSSITPGAGADAWVASLTLPVIAIVLNYVTASAQQIRSAVIAQRDRDFVRTLRSRGLGEGEILFKHVLRGAAPAGLTVLSLQFVGLLGGAVIIERIFAIPGIGQLAVDATVNGDIPIVMGVVLYTVGIVILVNLAVDLANGWLNPKVRTS
ncbi:ABC transporter permease [Nocardiopsis sediminis]|uniref:ABC transporter permease n=1 Tax=Nocardiopsis sediminis TaxID=1778267 RepID=A0ABV8FJE1_9ACTN